ncbi:MFS transporter [Nocardia camponoti]|uniref:MFS transporter n=1 Tax=Nocardia camponoti TaxID=1616106 RepID=A0A917QK82_9NOCA|nr:MFS transporter [Nocardia camponoti]GGK54347.1 MFS transporter [Nocardia camponoti]
MPPDAPVRLSSARGKWILTATVLGSSVASLDATVVNVALPKIGESLHTGVAGLQWTVNAYTLTLASFILLGGSLGDRLGRRRVFVWGAWGFVVTSILCALANDVGLLVGARLLQGIAGALLTPGSLALISSSIAREDQGTAIGLWSGLSGVAGAIGPLFGGGLIDWIGWRSIFLLNVPIALAVVYIAKRYVPESRDPHAPSRLDLPGAIVVAVALGALTFGLIDERLIFTIAGGVGLVIFVLIELRSPFPLVPPRMFKSRVFSAANLVTLFVYAANGGIFFLLVLQLQLVAGYSPIKAGAATMPVTLLMLILSAPAGRWAQKHGAHWPMTLGPLIAAVGVLLMQRVGPHANYVSDVLPSLLIFGIGLSVMVAPLTGAVLGAIPEADAGIASGVNNAVARTAQLLAVAALPGLAGISGAFHDPVVFASGFDTAMRWCAILLAIGGLIAAIGLSDVKPRRQPDRVDCLPHCAGTDGPALAPRSAGSQPQPHPGH